MMRSGAHQQARAENGIYRYKPFIWPCRIALFSRDRDVTKRQGGLGVTWAYVCPGRPSFKFMAGPPYPVADDHHLEAKVGHRGHFV